MAGRINTLTRPTLEQNDPQLDPGELLATETRAAMEERGAQLAEQERKGTRIRDWVELVPEARGPLDLKTYAFQEEPLYSQHAVEDAEQVQQKASQIGASTGSIRQALFHADVMQRTVIYTFPTDKELRDFSRKRIRPVIRASEHLRSRMSSESVDNVGQKQIGWNGWIQFRGLNEPVEAIDADVVIFDEYDRSDPINVEASERRVTGPQSAGIVRRLGVPSIPNYGIGAAFDQSDQRAWTVPCEGCGEWNPIRGFESFQRNVDQERVQLVCSECRKPIDVRRGEWVPAFPDREVRGYHMPKLLIPSRRVLAGVIASSKKTRPDQKTSFFNYDLGEPFAPAEGRLSLDQVRANCRPGMHLLEGIASLSYPITMGIDVASTRALNVVIEEGMDHESDRTIGRKVFVGEVEDEPGGRTAFQLLCYLMNAFGVHMACIDGNPEGRFANALAETFPGRVYVTRFFTPGGNAKKQPEPWIIDDEKREVSLLRTNAYDATFERFRRQHALMPPLDEMPGDYAAHLGNLYRQKIELPNGTVRVDYLKTGPEDWAQAEAYNLCAIELYHRNAGLGALVDAAPTSLAEEADFTKVSLADPDSPLDYRPGFEED